MNDDSALLAQRMEKLEKELFVNQEAFNRDIHQEVEKNHEDRIGSSLSRTDQDANARRLCISSMHFIIIIIAIFIILFQFDYYHLYTSIMYLIL